MSLTQLASKRWRAQVYDHRTGKNVSVGVILGTPGVTYATKREAKAAREQARALLGQVVRQAVTVESFAERWTTDPIFERPKQSTNIHNAERVKGFVKAYGSLPLALVTDEVVAEWLAGGTRNGTVPALRAMFNDARSAKAGRLVDRNPFAELGISRGKGNAEKDPPPESLVWDLIGAARERTLPSFAAWLQVAAFTGMRPGELDGLRWSAVDFERGLIRVREQWNVGSKTFTLPKNGKKRTAVLTPPAREALLSLPRQSSSFCFLTSRNTHWTPGARAYHWNAVRAAVGYDDTLYMATRHFAGSYMTNTLGLDSEIVAIALGHEDGGELVRRLYGHRDRRAALDAVARAYEGATVLPLRVVKEEA
jgi:integrase